MTNELNVEKLAAAVVRRACIDYNSWWISREKLKLKMGKTKKPKEWDRNKMYELNWHIKEVESFFKGEVIQMYTPNIDGIKLMNGVQKQAQERFEEWKAKEAEKKKEKKQKKAKNCKKLQKKAKVCS